MIPQPSEPVKPRPAARDRGAWHANPYQRESALDLAKRLVRAALPTPTPLSDAAVAQALKHACRVPKSVTIAELPTRFETRLAFFEAVVAKCAYRADEERNTPKVDEALRAFVVLADLPPTAGSVPNGFVRPNHAIADRPHTPATTALLRWTGVDVREKGRGYGLSEQEARLLWELCVKAAAWQRAVKAARQPDALPISADLVRQLSVSQALDAAEAWRFSCPSPIEEKMIMEKQQNQFPFEDDEDEGTPDGIRTHRPSTPPSHVDDEETGEWDLPPGVAKEIADTLDEEDADAALQQRTQDEPLDPEPDDEETPRQFRERLAQILTDAGVRDLAAAFKAATGYGNLDAAIGAGKTRAEIESQIAAYAETQKNAPQPPSKPPARTETPNPQNERPLDPKIGQSGLVPMGDSPEASRFAVMVNQAQMFLNSGFLPSSIRTVAQVMTLAAMGEQLGISPIAAINGIDVIQGRPSIKPQLMLALIRKSGQLEDLKVTDDGTTCTVVMTRKGMSPHTETFDMADAAAMNLTGKENWRKQPAVMRKWRAISAAARIVFPDVIWGFYTPDEMGATSYE